MANPQRGELALQVGEKSYTLRFSANALCALEDALDVSVVEFGDMLTDPKRVRLKTVRAVMWAGLQDHHPAITLKEAGDIIQELTMAKAMAAIGSAFELAFPTPDPTQPDQSQHGGIGPASSRGGLKAV